MAPLGLWEQLAPLAPPDRPALGPPAPRGPGLLAQLALHLLLWVLRAVQGLLAQLALTQPLRVQRGLLELGPLGQLGLHLTSPVQLAQLGLAPLVQLDRPQLSRDQLAPQGLRE